VARGYFITGTDTGSGKTAVTAAILRWLRTRGVNAATMKPVQTGAKLQNSRMIAPDLAFHHAAANFTPPSAHVDRMAPYLYELACSPHLAARMARRYPDIDRILASARGLEKLYDVLLIEGAGGIYVPLTESETMLDLMQRLGYPIILVARRGLGTINHTLLSLEALRHARLDVAGVIFNEAEDVAEDFIRQDNPRAVEAFGRVPVLGNMDFLPGLDANPAKALEGSERFLPGLARLFPELG
jgi:dethiobiotin synthetase